MGQSLADIAILDARVRWLRDQLDGLPALTGTPNGAGSEWIARRTRRAQALDALVARLAAMPDRPVVTDGSGAAVRVRMLGITSTSTMGVMGALRNWLVRAIAVTARVSVSR